jgi:hypothetical protein
LLHHSAAARLPREIRHVYSPTRPHTHGILLRLARLTAHSSHLYYYTHVALCCLLGEHLAPRWGPALRKLVNVTVWFTKKKSATRER